MLPGLSLDPELALVIHDMLDDSPLLEVRDVLLRSDNRLNAHDLTVLNQVKDEAVIVKYRVRRARVFLQLPLPCFVLFIEYTVGLPFERPLIHYILVQLLLLQRRFNFVIVEPEVFQSLLHVLLLN